MKGNTFNYGLVSTAVILTFAPATQAFPQWMKPRHIEEVKNAPSGYNVYEPPQYGGSYTYGGLGPQPTIATTLASVSSATSEASGEETSSSSSKFFPHCSKVQSSHYSSFHHCLYL